MLGEMEWKVVAICHPLAIQKGGGKWVQFLFQTAHEFQFFPLSEDEVIQGSLHQSQDLSFKNLPVLYHDTLIL